MKSKTEYWPTTLKLPKFAGDKSKLSPSQRKRINSYESSMNLANLHAPPIIRFGQKKKGTSGPPRLRLIFLCWWCKKKVRVVPNRVTTFRYCSVECAAKHRSELGFAAEKRRKNHHFRKKKRTRKLSTLPIRKCKYCGKSIELKKLLPKERSKRKFCSISCSQKYYGQNPTQAMIEGRKVRNKKSGETRRGRPLTKKHKKAHAKAMAKRRGEKWSPELRKKLSEAQKKRWAKLPTVRKTKRIWRITKQAKTIQKKLNWPKERLEYQIQIKRVNGQFKKGETYFLYVDLAHPETKLAIEIDGTTHLHDKQKRIDRWKEKQLENLGWKVLRFWNKEVDENPQKVCRKIQSTISKLKKHTTSSQQTV